MAFDPKEPNELRGRKARAEREDALLALTGLFIDKPAPTRDARFETTALESKIRSKWGSCRKIDLVALCAAQGYYKIATLLIETGSDWKFASKQCSQWLIKRNRHEEPDAEAQTTAFFEAVSLRRISEKSSTRRDARIEKKGEDPISQHPTALRRL